MVTTCKRYQLGQKLLETLNSPQKQTLWKPPLRSFFFDPPPFLTAPRPGWGVAVLSFCFFVLVTSVVMKHSDRNPEFLNSLFLPSSPFFPLAPPAFLDRPAWRSCCTLLLRANMIPFFSQLLGIIGGIFAGTEGFAGGRGSWGGVERRWGSICFFFFFFFGGKQMVAAAIFTVFNVFWENGGGFCHPKRSYVPKKSTTEHRWP